MEIISSDTGTQFTSTEFQDKCQTFGVHTTSAALEHQEMNGKGEVTWIILLTIAHSLTVCAIVLEAYINFLLMYT